MNVHSFLKNIMTKRTQILIAAENILADRGFYGFSMHSLAEVANVAAGTIYRYFPSKEALMQELHQHIRLEAANTIFIGFDENLLAKQKYDLLWKNCYNAVLKNPKRLSVIEMLYFMPDVIEDDNLPLLEDQNFTPLITFYADGVKEGLFLDWQVSALITLSLDSSINLAKKVLRHCFTPQQHEVDMVREASWNTILKPPFKQ